MGGMEKGDREGEKEGGGGREKENMIMQSSQFGRK